MTNQRCLNCMRMLCRYHRKGVGWRLLPLRFDSPQMQMWYMCSGDVEENCEWADDPPCCLKVPRDWVSGGARPR